MRAALFACVAASFACSSTAPPASPRVIRDARVSLRIDTGEADAAVALLDTPESDTAWQRVVASPSFQRLTAREQSMKRTVDLAAFRAHLVTLGRTGRGPTLREALARWQTIDLRAIANRIFPYLPAEARIEATIYPVIKPRDNSFVYHDAAGSAIFINVDPTMTTADIDNTIAHELHHIGYGSLAEVPCPGPAAKCIARTWVGAFGEGFAMLAAAGSPDVHPRGAAKPYLRADWDRNVVDFDKQLADVQAFLRDVLDGKLGEDAARDRAMDFFGLQGPWYTVGWVMAVAVERCAGRAALVEAMRRPWTILGAYNDAREKCPGAKGPGTAVWDRDVIRAVSD